YYVLLLQLSGVILFYTNSNALQFQPISRRNSTPRRPKKAISESELQGPGGQTHHNYVVQRRGGARQRHNTPGTLSSANCSIPAT
ncbi:hypothetical protein CEXT_300991, partial [Caerostris extrusa]